MAKSLFVGYTNIPKQRQQEQKNGDPHRSYGKKPKMLTMCASSSPTQPGTPRCKAASQPQRVHPAVHIDGLAGDAAGEVAGEVDRRLADVGTFDVASKRAVGGDVLADLVRPPHRRRRQRAQVTPR